MLCNWLFVSKFKEAFFASWFANFWQSFSILVTMWNSRSPCGAESVAERLSSHCWTKWLALDKENHWQSTSPVAPDGWVHWALNNPLRCCSILLLDGAAQNGLGIESSKAVTHPTICGAQGYYLPVSVSILNRKIFNKSFKICNRMFNLIKYNNLLLKKWLDI